MPQNFAARLQKILSDDGTKLRAIPEADSGRRAGDRDGWSRKQELGHLIDSAVNNRIRFNVAALEGRYTGPTYDGNGWVDLGGYTEMPWTDIVETWTVLNRALAIGIQRIPKERLSASCKVGDHDPWSLESLIEDYIDHMQHHLEHILEADQQR